MGCTGLCAERIKTLTVILSQIIWEIFYVLLLDIPEFKNSPSSWGQKDTCLLLIHNSFRGGYCIVAGHAGKHQFSVVEWEQGQTGVKWD